MPVERLSDERLLLTRSENTGDRKKAYSPQMKKSSKAALLSGLIFPGIGHIFLREYFRGSALVVLCLAALSVVVKKAYQHAMLIVDRVFSGDLSVEAGAIAQAVSNATSAGDSLVENAAVIVLVACWLVGIMDSYRLGTVQEHSDM